jgi:hypothetical protein
VVALHDGATWKTYTSEMLGASALVLEPQALAEVAANGWTATELQRTPQLVPQPLEATQPLGHTWRCQVEVLERLEWTAATARLCLAALVELQAEQSPRVNTAQNLWFLVLAEGAALLLVAHLRRSVLVQREQQEVPAFIRLCPIQLAWPQVLLALQALLFLLEILAPRSHQTEALRQQQASLVVLVAEVQWLLCSQV